MKKDFNFPKGVSTIAEDIGEGYIVFKDSNINLIDVGTNTRDFHSQEEYEEYKKSLKNE